MITSEWAKSSYSGPNCDNCVECRTVGGNVEVRDSKNPSGPVQVFTPAEWDAFIKGAKASEFDLA
ncbi:MAG: DUF397 domain-containing protein [Micromonospora sp.]